MSNRLATVPEANYASEVGPLIRSVRGHRVILDADLARIYGVETKRLNEQCRRNLDRFPEDFAFRPTRAEWAALTSQDASSSRNPDLKSQNATSSFAHGGRRKLPLAFTEHGALMAANVLNSPRAVAMSVYVIRAFIKMREDLAANAAILKRLAEIDKTLLVHDSALRDIYQKIRPLLEPPPLPPRPETGFHIKEEAAPYRVNRP
jgi:hypothetical protein